MKISRTLQTSTIVAALALAWPLAHAEMPSVQAVIQYTGNQAGGGNGGYPPVGNSSIVYPNKAFVEDGSGYLYSATAGGGGYAMATNTYSVAGQGELFYRYRPAGGQEILDRGIDTGNLRPKQMTYASNGSLYSIEGTTANQGGLRRYTPGVGWQVLAVTPFGITTPWIEGADGRMFNIRGGNRDVYAVEKDGTGGVQLIHTLDSTATSRGTLMLSHSNGRLYGFGTILRNTGGGNAWRPLVFSILPNGTDMQVHRESIGDFGTAGGGLSVSGLVEAADGRLYGSTPQGGANGTGVLFRLNPDGSDYQELHVFGPTVANIDGMVPTSLARGADGHIYGTTQNGGVNGNGVVFRWNTVSNTYQALYAFSALTAHTPMGNNTGTNLDGTQPLGLMRASDGTLYGMARLGGQRGWGTVFRFNPGDEVPVFRYRPRITLNATALSNVGAGFPTAANTVAVGREVTFSWTSELVSNCVASTTAPGNPWNGSRPDTSTSDRHTPTQVGRWTYSLICQSGDPVNFPDPVVGSFTIDVEAVTPPTETGGNGGGGALGWLAGPLALLGALAWRRRRRA